MKVRTRFAPSPTGYLHVGGLRTALYNFLFAKQNNGEFVLRIEDTDQNRIVDSATENLIDILLQLNLIYDFGPNKSDEHGPYMQSLRLDLYKKYYIKYFFHLVFFAFLFLSYSFLFSISIKASSMVISTGSFSSGIVAFNDLYLI